MLKSSEVKKFGGYIWWCSSKLLILVNESFAAVGTDDEDMGELIDSVAPVTSLNCSVNFSEMYKSVVSSTSPSLIVPPIETSTEEEQNGDEELTL